MPGLGIVSLLNLTEIDPEAATLTAPASDTLPEVLANMAPDKATRMLEILEVGGWCNRNDFMGLYKTNDPSYADYQSFLKKITLPTQLSIIS